MGEQWPKTAFRPRRVISKCTKPAFRPRRGISKCTIFRPKCTAARSITHKICIPTSAGHIKMHYFSAKVHSSTVDHTQKQHSDLGGSYQNALFFGQSAQ